MLEREKLVKINEYLGNLQKFKQCAMETECQVLQHVVDSINSNIEGVCMPIFEDDISVTLKLFKRMKSTNNVKPTVNFDIAYKNGIYDNINQISGGEADRVSLALTLALSRLSTCPIIMLDESLAGLDLTMKETVISTLAENSDKAVIVIMHDGVEGIFSNAISIDEIEKGRY